MVCLVGLSGGGLLFSLKRALQYDKENVELLVIMHNIISGQNQTQHISTNTSYQRSSTVMEG